MADLNLLRTVADQVAAGPSQLRLRQGVIVSWMTGHTCEVFIGGDYSAVTVARYVSPFPPRIGSTVWIAVDGADAFIIGSLAPESPPVANVRVPSGALPTIATATATTIAYSDVFHDPTNIADGTGFTVWADGIYTCDARLFWEPNANGQRRLRILVNTGTGALALEDYRFGHATEPTVNHCHGLLELHAGDVVTVEARQTSGAGLAVANYRNFASLTYTAPLPAPVTDVTGLVANSGFEDGLLAWTVDRPADWSIATSGAYAGAQAAKYVSFTGSTVLLGDPIDIPPAVALGGTTWTGWQLSARIKHTTPAAHTITLGVQADSTLTAATGTPPAVPVTGNAGSSVDDVYGITGLSATTSWSQLSTGTIVSLPPGTRTVRPVINLVQASPSGSSTVLIDDVELTLFAWES